VLTVSYNGVATKQLDLAKLSSMLDSALQTTFELIVVDNASKDSTSIELNKLKNKHKNLQIHSLVASIDPVDALIEAANHSNAQLLFCLDFDSLGHISNLDYYVKQLAAADCLRGVRKKNGFSVRNIGSLLFNLIFTLISGKKIIDIGSNFYLFNRKVLKYLIKERQNDSQIFLPLLLYSKNISIIDIEIATFDSGRSAYSLSGLLNRALRILIGALRFRFYRAQVLS
jgi:glycosyltransferase involved in cell wall biosynthesis